MPIRKAVPKQILDMGAEHDRADGWQNIATGLGTGIDKRTVTKFVSKGRMDRETLAALYAQSDTVARIVDLLPDEALREGWHCPTDADGALSRACEELQLVDRLKEAWAWSRLDGGALILIGAYDGRRMSRPLDEENIEDVSYLTVFDAWEARVAKRYTDPFRPNYGEPEIYEIISNDPGVAGEGLANIFSRAQTAAAGVVGTGLGRLVHESRVVRFDSQLCKRQDKRAYFSWGPGIIERVYPVIRDFDAGYASMATLLQDFAQGVLKIENLAVMMGRQGGDKLVQKRLAAMDMMRSSLRAIPLDAAKEDFTRVATPVSGLADLLDHLGRRLSSATGYPITIFFGQSPGGLNSTGEGDSNNLFNVVKSGQRMHLTRPLTKLLRVIAKAKAPNTLDKHGQVPFSFRPLWQSSDLEISTARLNDAKADDLRIRNGSITPQEVADSRFGSGAYSTETKLDPSAAPRELPEPAPAAPKTEAKKPAVG